jgi:hypothetical protein
MGPAAISLSKGYALLKGWGKWRRQRAGSMPRATVARMEVVHEGRPQTAMQRNPGELGGGTEKVCRRSRHGLSQPPHVGRRSLKRLVASECTDAAIENP